MSLVATEKVPVSSPGSIVIELWLPPAIPGAGAPTTALPLLERMRMLTGTFALRSRTIVPFTFWLLAPFAGSGDRMRFLIGIGFTHPALR